MKRFVIGDIHGAHRALLQCFERSGFDRNKDLLICLGDLCDGWSDVYAVFDELLDIRNLVLLLGNHDSWLLNWFETGDAPDIWLVQGGIITTNAYSSEIPATHVSLLKNARLYYILDNNLFVHGGFMPGSPIELQDKEVLLWDRSLVKAALYHRKNRKEVRLTQYNKVFVGHTPTINFDSIVPITTCGICLMDTGAGWPGGVLTIMNIDTGECFSSEVVGELYYNINGRT
jgi:serine/threonine protein phosphatase 1